MPRQTLTFEEVEKELMEDPEFKQEYERNKPFSNIALEIVKARCLAGLSQAELAKRIGTTQAVISKIENLSIKDIKVSTLYKVSQALGLNLDIKFTNAA
jgi:ribosome-binding protein aMBF1 (putative translation factor)